MNLVVLCISVLLACPTLSFGQNLAVGVGGEVAFPQGTFADTWGTGTGGSGSLEFGLARQINGYVRVGYWRFATKYSGLDPATFLSFLGGAKIGFGGPYLGVELGYYKSTVSGSWGYTWDGIYYSGTYSENLGGFEIAPVAGYEFGVSEHMAIDLSAKYAIVKDSDHFGLRAGLKFGL
jgi:hypothetical protein